MMSKSESRAVRKMIGKVADLARNSRHSSKPPSGSSPKPTSMMTSSGKRSAKARLASGIAVVVAVNEGRAAIAVGVTDDLVATLSAVDLVRAGVAVLGGQGGGGRPDMAQGGGPDGVRGDEAIAAVKAAAMAGLGVAA